MKKVFCNNKKIIISPTFGIPWICVELPESTSLLWVGILKKLQKDKKLHTDKKNNLAKTEKKVT